MFASELANKLFTNFTIEKTKMDSAINKVHKSHKKLAYEPVSIHTQVNKPHTIS